MRSLHKHNIHELLRFYLPFTFVRTLNLLESWRKRNGIRQFAPWKNGDFTTQKNALAFKAN